MLWHSKLDIHPLDPRDKKSQNNECNEENIEKIKYRMKNIKKMCL